jgi:hypothetical protein
MVRDDSVSAGDDSKARQRAGSGEKDVPVRGAYLREVRIVLVRSTTASSFNPSSPIELLARLSAC